MLITLATVVFFSIFILSLGPQFAALFFTAFIIRDEEISDKNPLSYVSSSSLGYYSKAAIVADAPGCAAHGRKILEKSGSLMDAAISTLLCTGVVNLHSMGVGGGFLMVYYNASENRTYALDAREAAPASATEKMFVGKPPIAHVHGPLAIAIPSELKGYYAAWKKFGKLPWSELFEDVIKMCREGISVSPTLDTILKVFGNQIPAKTPLWYLLYNETEGRLKTTNETVVRPVFANFLERVAANPEDILNGTLVKEIADDLKKAGSIITLQDLVDYEPLWRQPLEMPLRSKGMEIDLRLTTSPPPSSGVLVGLALNALASYNYTDGGRFTGNGTLYYHRLTEVLKFIFAKRSYLPGDCCSSTEDKKFLESLMTLDTADEIAAKVTDYGTHNLSYYESIFTPPRDQGTAHVSLVGPNGDAISITSTINTPFGSGIIGSQTGILFNNEMDDFSTPDSPNAFGLPPSPKHFIKPGARPISSMAPIIIAEASNGTPRVIIGAAGGSRIITSIIQTTYANLNLRMNMKQAIDAIRIHHQLIPNKLQYESHLSPEILKELAALGHELDEGSFISAVQGIEITESPCPDKSEGRCLIVNSDYRKGGDHAGF
nr:gamma-glutamyl transpeptidase [Hymenolepis microstoma]